VSTFDPKTDTSKREIGLDGTDGDDIQGVAACWGSAVLGPGSTSSDLVFLWQGGRPAHPPSSPRRTPSGSFRAIEGWDDALPAQGWWTRRSGV